MANPVSSGAGSSFSVSYDSMTKLISALACILLIGIALFTRSIGVGFLAALVIGLSYAWSPRGYIVSEEWIFVKRLIGSVRIPVHSIRDVRAADSEDLRGCIRVFGNGGLFGYYGLYRTSKLGTCNWYVTNRDNAVVLITGGRAAILSPDDVNGFLFRIRSAAPIQDASPHKPVSYFARSGGSGGLIGKLIGIIIGIVVVLLVLAAMLYSPGPPEYTLNSGELTIHDRFYPVTVKAADVDLEKIRVVDIGSDPRWKPVVRTNGFSNAHYHSGWFRVAGGEKIRMYRADGKHLVLLPTKDNGPSVLVEVKQPEAFIQELRRMWQ